MIVVCVDGVALSVLLCLSCFYVLICTSRVLLLFWFDVIAVCC